jgi:predicted phage terminase large subunit-like protein
MAAPTGGQVTGFRAGRLEDGMQGAMSVDDPIKPEDCLSLRIRTKLNARWGNTVRSRMARIETPVVVIMQRLHEDDLSGFLLKGGSGEKWHHLIIPAEVTESSKDYPDEYTHGIPVDYPAPLGYTWPLRVSGDFATALKADPVLWATQYQQEPTVDTGEIFHSDWWGYYEFFDAVNSQIVFEDGTRILVRYKNIYADTAMKTGEQHDWSVFELFAKLVDDRIALLELERGKWESYELRDRFITFCNRFKFQAKVNNMGVRHRKVEDKASGIGLIQDVNNELHEGYVEGIPRDKDKVSRAKSCAPQIALGKVLLPRSAAWLGEYLREFHKFNSGMTHKHDDQIDPTMDAIEDMIIRDGGLNYGEVV